MHASYEDITSRIPTEPLWFDEYAVPRYCDFSPARSASIHIGEIALAEITCQECRKKFHVALSDINFRGGIAEAIRNRTLDYGDPPRHDGSPNDPRACTAGASMNSEPRRVIEYWHRHDRRHVDSNRKITNLAYFEWVRDPLLEIDIQPDWVERR
jgi:hypothetical protein